MLPWLDGGESDGYFSFDATQNALMKCGIIRRHEVASPVAGVPAQGIAPASWGKHLGPLTSSPVGAEVILMRWVIPAEPDATMSASTVHLVPGVLPDSGTIYWGSPVDLPWGQTLLSYTSQTINGEALLVDDSSAVLARARVVGFFSAMGVSQESTRRVVFSGLSPLTDGPPDASVNGIYAAEVCDGGLGRLSFTAPACLKSSLLSTWSGYSGPIIADRNGNVFVEKFSTSNEFGGYSQQVAFYTSAALFGASGGFSSLGDGVLVFNAPGSMRSMAALAPSAGKPGMLLTIPLSVAGLTTYSAPSTFDSKGPLIVPRGSTTLSVFTETFGSVGGRYFWVAANQPGDDGGVFFKVKCDGP